MKETKKLMMHPSEHERHASITQKVENEMEKRKRETGAYTPENVIKQLEELKKEEKTNRRKQTEENRKPNVSTANRFD